MKREGGCQCQTRLRQVRGDRGIALCIATARGLGKPLRGCAVPGKLGQRGLDRREGQRRQRRPGPAERAAFALRQALEAFGVEFIPENGGGPGVRLRK